MRFKLNAFFCIPWPLSSLEMVHQLRPKDIICQQIFECWPPFSKQFETRTWIHNRVVFEYLQQNSTHLLVSAPVKAPLPLPWPFHLCHHHHHRQNKNPDKRNERVNISLKYFQFRLIEMVSFVRVGIFILFNFFLLLEICNRKQTLHFHLTQFVKFIESVSFFVQNNNF